MARIQSQKKDTTHFNTSLAAIRAQVQREVEAERKAKSELEKQSSLEQTNAPKVLTDDHNRALAAQGVYFRFDFLYLFIDIFGFFHIEYESNFRIITFILTKMSFT